MRKLIASIVTIHALCSCGSSPVNQAGVEPGANGQKGFSLDFEEIMEFDQGVSKTYPITAVVPPPGEVVVTAEALPEGATIDGTNLTYTPPCSLNLAEGKFYRGYITFRILISLKSDKDENSMLQKAGILMVYRHNDPNRPCGR